MFGAILKATNSSFQKSMTFCRSIYVKKVMKLLAFIFEQPSYIEILENRSVLLIIRDQKKMHNLILIYYFYLYFTTRTTML